LRTAAIAIAIGPSWGDREIIFHSSTMTRRQRDARSRERITKQIISKRTTTCRNGVRCLHSVPSADPRSSEGERERASVPAEDPDRPSSINADSIVHGSRRSPARSPRQTGSQQISPISMHASMCHGDRPITSRCSMTARPKKSPCHTARAILARVARLENRFVDCTPDWTTIHEERRTGALAEAATTAAVAPATVPREYYATPFPTPLPLPTSPSAPPYPALAPRPPRTRPVLVAPSILSLSAVRVHPTGIPTLSLPRFSSSRPLSRVAAPTTCRGHPYDSSEGGCTRRE